MRCFNNLSNNISHHASYWQLRSFNFIDSSSSVTFQLSFLHPSIHPRSFSFVPVFLVRDSRHVITISSNIEFRFVITISMLYMSMNFQLFSIKDFLNPAFIQITFPQIENLSRQMEATTNVPLQR